MDKRYITSLYRKLGLNTESSVIEKQAQVVEKAFLKITLSQAQILILIAFGVNVSQDALDWLVDIAEEANPGLASSGVDGDVLVVALALLRQILENETVIAPAVALAIETVSFGGKQVCKDDAELLNFAQEKLLKMQTSKSEVVPVIELEQSSLEEELEDVDQANFAAAWPRLREVLEEIDARNNDVLEAHNAKLRELIDANRALEEQLQTQWFAISKWSKTAGQPFSKLGIGEAATRAAYELAKIAKSPVGPAAAPALLNMALADVNNIHEENLLFTELCVASPIIWRKSWVRSNGGVDKSKLTPIMAGLALASQADDEPDWYARFRREIGVDPQFNLSPFAFALQLFHELLVVKFMVQ